MQLTAAPKNIDCTLFRATTINNITDTEDIFDSKEKEVESTASSSELVLHHLTNNNISCCYGTFMNIGCAVLCVSSVLRAPPGPGFPTPTIRS